MNPNPHEWISTEAALTLERLLPRIEMHMRGADDADLFIERLQREFPRLFRLLYFLYGDQYDFFYHLEMILTTAAHMFVERSDDLRALDRQREQNPLWFQSSKMVGGVLYVDRFVEDVRSLHDKIPYFKELGLTYVHLMPLFQVPPVKNDGGYAVSDYRNVRSDLGTMEDLVELAAAFRKEGISLVLDFIFNHTSDEHEWARRALLGEDRYQKFYHMFPDRTMPDQYEATMREIFPEQAPGNFTYREDVDRWVWTSFWGFQWDLNYKNPDVFNAMLGEMLFLANQGVEVLRLDAVAFIWKELGTASENRPQAHMIIQAYNALTRIVAPAMLFKSEAIVHPNDVASYIGWHEAPLSYNPTLMALLWEALATREVKLLQHSMARRFNIPQNTAWVNYVRVHDDIGWTFADEDAAEIQINGYDHRQFLNSYYLGSFQGSFAKGLPFGFNEKTGDMRISGTGASLAGIEQGLDREDDTLVEMGLRRFLLIHSMILSAGGIPLIYLGDELATTNDYSYRDDPKHKDDSRWAHRGEFDWQRAALRHDPDTVPGFMFTQLQRMIEIRKRTPALGRGSSTFFNTGNPHVLGFMRSGRVLVLANFSEREQTIERQNLLAFAPIDRPARDLLAETDDPKADLLPQTVQLSAYAVQWWLFEGAY